MHQGLSFSNALDLALAWNTEWENNAIADCNGNPPCIQGVQQQAQANAAALYALANGALNAVYLAFITCINAAMSICSLAG